MLKLANHSTVQFYATTWSSNHFTLHYFNKSGKVATAKERHDWCFLYTLSAKLSRVCLLKLDVTKRHTCILATDDIIW